MIKASTMEEISSICNTMNNSKAFELDTSKIISRLSDLFNLEEIRLLFIKYILNLEGCDACGKETQTKLLLNFFKNVGFTIDSISFPQYDNKSRDFEILYNVLKGNYGKAFEIDEYTRCMLFAVDRKQGQSKIDELYQNNNIVILDRYTMSNVYNISGHIVEMENWFNYIYDVEYNHMKLKKPDHILILESSPEFILDNIKKRKANLDTDVYESMLDFQELVMTRYLYFYKLFEQKIKDTKINIVTCYQSEMVENNKIFHRQFTPEYCLISIILTILKRKILENIF